MFNFQESSLAYAPTDIAGISDVANFNTIRKAASDKRLVQLAECAKLWENVVQKGMNPLYLKAAFSPTAIPEMFGTLQTMAPTIFNESMALGDFASLTDQVLDRAVIANFSQYPTTYDKVAKLNKNVKDFRQIRRYAHEGGTTVFDAVAQGEGFNRRKFAEEAYNYTVVKYAAGFTFSWEAAINDDLSILQDLPNRLGLGGYNSIEKYVTSLYVGSTGLNTSLYTAGQTNIVTSNAALSLTALGTAMTQMLGMLDDEGNPIAIRNLRLVVGPGLYVTAQNLKNQLIADTTVGGGASNNVLRVNPWLTAMFEVVLNPFIPIIATTHGATSWFLFADPNVGRPAIEVGFLNGFATPQLFKKASNTLRIGGGDASNMGDFDVMSTEYKAVMVYGGTQMEPKMTMGSNGSGS